MKKIGLTGGIGSGKSIVSRIFSCLQVPVFSADDEAKIIMESDQDVQMALKELFGEQLYSGGKLNKNMLGELIFNNKMNIANVNAIVHPVVVERFNRWAENNAESDFIIMEAAIIFETGVNRYLDMVINITAPEELRIDRVCKRDGVSKEKVIARINNQLTEKERIRNADINIVNDEKSMLLPQVLEVRRILSRK